MDKTDMLIAEVMAAQADITTGKSVERFLWSGPPRVLDATKPVITILAVSIAQQQNISNAINATVNGLTAMFDLGYRVGKLDASSGDTDAN